jgi:hypothetical protein
MMKLASGIWRNRYNREHCVLSGVDTSAKSCSKLTEYPAVSVVDMMKFGMFSHDWKPVD